MSNKDLLSGRQFLGINNRQEQKEKDHMVVTTHKQYYICRLEEEYHVIWFIYHGATSFYKLDGYKRFEELVRHDQCIFINSDICMSIGWLETCINAKVM